MLSVLFFFSFFFVVVVSQGAFTLVFVSRLWIHPAKCSLVPRPSPSIGSSNTGGDQTLDVGKP